MKPKPESNGPPPPPSRNFNLPVMPLPYFYGDYNEWIPYKDKFSRLIKDNETIDDVQGLHYLKESLKGQTAVLESTIDSFFEPPLHSGV
jgi:hypothetical protein